MGRILIAGVLVAFITVFLIGSFTDGAISRIADLSRMGRLLVFAAVCAIGGIVYLYLDGTIAHLKWLWDVPTRPAQELTFVANVESAIDQWSATAGKAHDCAKLTADLAAHAGEVTDWSGTIATKYRIGTGLALAVQIGRNTVLRTSYVQSPDAILIDKASPLFAASDGLMTGDPVIFSGSLVQDPAVCMVAALDASDGARAEFPFRFGSIRLK